MVEDKDVLDTLRFLDESSMVSWSADINELAILPLEAEDGPETQLDLICNWQLIANSLIIFLSFSVIYTLLMQM